MTRFGSVLLVALLSLSSSGAWDMLFPERCSITESTSSASDDSCGTACVRCHCARPFELTVAQTARQPVRTEPSWVPRQHAVPLAVPEDIFHVPKVTRL